LAQVPQLFFFRERDLNTQSGNTITHSLLHK